MPFVIYDVSEKYSLEYFRKKTSLAMSDKSSIDFEKLTEHKMLI